MSLRKKISEVRLVSGNLVASFPTAHPPLVWKFDLTRNHSFTVALQGEEGDWELGVVSVKGDFHSIAHFPEKEDAEDALAKTHKVLLKKKRTKIWFVVQVIFCLLVLALAGGAGWLYYVGQKHMSHDAAPQAQMRGAKPSPDAQGVPLSADDILQMPSQ